VADEVLPFGGAQRHGLRLARRVFLQQAAGAGLVALAAPALAGTAGSRLATTSSNLVVNGGFETGSFTGWVHGGPGTYVPVVTKAKAHSGKYSALIGHTAQPEVNGKTYIYQTLKLPSSASKITLQFYWLGGSNDEPQYDQQEALIMNASGTVALATVFSTLKNTPTWTKVVYDMTKLKGQVVRLYFAVSGNGYKDFNYMYVDDVSVTVA
jgi:hypothetical protein